MEKKEYWITNSRFKIILICLMIMWLGIMILFYLKADEVTKDPCSVCAERVGEEVSCTLGTSGKIYEKVYYPNFTIFIGEE